MHMLKVHRKKFLVGLAVVLLIGGAVAGFVWWKNNQKPKVTLESTKESMPPPVGGPTEDYANQLAQYLSTTKDPEEKAKGYKTLGDAYRILGKPKESLDAYKQAKQFEAYGNFTDEEKAAIDAGIAVMEIRARDISEPRTVTKPRYKEPSE